MSEALFVLKCLAVTIVLAFLMQMKISGNTVEAKLDRLIHNSGATAYLQDAAAGGMALARDGYYATKNFIVDSTSSIGKGESQYNRSSR